MAAAFERAAGAGWLGRLVAAKERFAAGFVEAAFDRTDRPLGMADELHARVERPVGGDGDLAAAEAARAAQLRVDARGDALVERREPELAAAAVVVDVGAAEAAVGAAQRAQVGVRPRGGVVERGDEVAHAEVAQPEDRFGEERDGGGGDRHHHRRVGLVREEEPQRGLDALPRAAAGGVHAEGVVRGADAVARERDGEAAAAGLGEERFVEERAVRGDLVVEAVRLARLAAVDEREHEVLAQERLAAEEDDPRVVPRREAVDRRLGRFSRHVRRAVPLVAVAAGEVAAVGEVEREVHRASRAAGSTGRGRGCRRRFRRRRGAWGCRSSRARGRGGRRRRRPARRC